MLAFFRINDPYRLIGIFLLIVLIRIPFLLGEMPLTIPELHWMLVGESISFNRVLYLDIWDDIAPLAGLVYSSIDAIAGRSQWGYQILAILVLFLQCYLFNQLLISNKAYKENTYVPALIYAILMSVFFDFFTLSPPLMSGVFQLLVINRIFHHIAVKAKDEYFLNIGLALGLSTLIYLPSLIYLPISIVALGLYSSMTFKKYILMIFGFIFPLVLVGIFFFWHGALLDFFNYYFFSWASTLSHRLVSIKTLWLISIPAILLCLFSFFKISTASRYNNHQTNYMLVMMLFLVGAVVMVIMSKEMVPHQLMVFVTPVSYFLGHYFLLVKRRLVSELIFTGFLAVSLITNYGVLYGFVIPAGLVDYQDLLVSSTPWDELVTGKKLLILGDEPDAYLHAYPATPYLNWSISEKHLSQTNSFNNLSRIYHNFLNDLPEVILDQEGVVPDLFRRMPTIASMYTREGEAYLLKP